jgi:hypothetical protein
VYVVNPLHHWLMLCLVHGKSAYLKVNEQARDVRVKALASLGLARLGRGAYCSQLLAQRLQPLVGVVRFGRPVESTAHGVGAKLLCTKPQCSACSALLPPMTSLMLGAQSARGGGRRSSGGESEATKRVRAAAGAPHTPLAAD